MPAKSKNVAKLGETKQKALEALFQDLPQDFESRYAQLQALHQAFHEQLAAQLEPSLNEHIRRQPAGGFQAKRKIATWVDKTTRDVGVTVTDPDTGNPALLVAEYKKTREPNSGSCFGLLAPGRYGIGRIDGEELLEQLFLKLSPAPTELESLFRKFRPSSLRKEPYTR